jgi:hypothetical protein
MRRVPLAIALCATLSSSLPVFAQHNPNEDSRHIFELTNQERIAHGLQPLAWDLSLASAAQAHAQLMASQEYLSHQYPGEPPLSTRAAQPGTRFQVVAENIATAYSDDGVEKAWMSSPPHRANILDPRMNSLGVGVVEKNGMFYAVEDFGHSAESLSSTEIEGKVGTLLRRENITPSAPRDAAAVACDSDSGYPKGVTGKLIVRFNTPDLSRLPNGVAAQIHSGSYRSASVASCSSQGATYHVAIVLY